MHAVTHMFVCSCSWCRYYPTPDRFGNLMLPNVQITMSGEYEVQVRLPGLGTNGEPLNANSPRSVNVDVQGQ